MEFKLVKTVLSQRPSSQSILVGLTGLLVLFCLFAFHHSNELSANGKIIFEEHQYWRAFTTTLVHADYSHLGHNAIAFTLLAVLLNNYFGVWIFPILSLVMGGIINIITLKFYSPEIYLVGISGVIYFMASFWMVMYIGIERRLTLVRRLMNVLGISLIFLFPQVFNQQTSYMAHGVGYALGIPSGLIYFWKNKSQFHDKEVWVEISPPPAFLGDENYWDHGNQT